MSEDAKQLKLFDIASQRGRRLRQEMSCEQLTEWRERIANHQRAALRQGSLQQGTLFEMEMPHIDPDRINPYKLAYQSLSFWRRPANRFGHPCLYFVTDLFVPLVLYIGESNNDQVRWKSQHDCKTYLDRYASVVRRYGLRLGTAIAFWFETPHDRKARQALERALIQKWQPPFNKECWQRWGQPFGKS